MAEIDICLTTLEDVTREETEQVSDVVAPPTQGNSPQQADEPSHGGGRRDFRNYIYCHSMSIFKDRDSSDSAINSNQSLTPVEKFPNP